MELLAGLPLEGWVIPLLGGLFEPLPEFEPGAAWVKFLHVTEDDEVVDTIAWESEQPGRWLAHRDLVTYVGQDELDRSWWDDKPARLVATPADYVACHGQAFCILDWRADINAVIGRAAAVECDSEALQRFLSETLHRQATAHLRKLKITAVRRRAA